MSPQSHDLFPCEIIEAVWITHELCLQITLRFVKLSCGNAEKEQFAVFFFLHISTIHNTAFDYFLNIMTLMMKNVPLVMFSLRGWPHYALEISIPNIPI